MIDSLLILAQRGDQGAEAAGALCGLCFFFGIMAVSIATSVFHIWMIIDCAMYESKMPDNQLVMWILLMIFLGLFGSVPYYFIRRPHNRIGMSPQHKPQAPPQDQYWQPPY